MDIKAHLDALLWSKVDLAHNADISVSTVNRIFDGHTVSRALARKIVDAFSKAYGRKMTISEIEGLNVSSTTRKKKGEKQQEEAKKVNRKPRTKKTEQA